ncbi:hypothetical protein LTR17_019745 [Elasticomyces elasticus]|nr:hypothetical protein LTR17_019745 [Elasticomyces elasticus]
MEVSPWALVVAGQGARASVRLSNGNKTLDHSHNRVYERYPGDDHVVSGRPSNWGQVPEVIERATKLGRLLHDFRGLNALTPAQIEHCRSSTEYRRSQAGQEYARARYTEKHGSVARSSVTNEGKSLHTLEGSKLRAMPRSSVKVL